MTHHYIAHAFLSVKSERVEAVFSSSQRSPIPIDTLSNIAILEIFAFYPSVARAYEVFQTIASKPLDESEITKLEPYRSWLDRDFKGLIFVGNQQISILKNGFNSFFSADNRIELSEMSQSNPQVLSRLLQGQPLENNLDRISTFSEFEAAVRSLNDLGLLSPEIRSIDWGDLRKTAAFCSAFGLTRGTPIDRYYLKQFVNQIRSSVTGNVLELGGGSESDRQFYQFDLAQTYQTLNLEAAPGVDIVGDVHDRTCIEPESFDAIVIFNVLEHCHAPWMAVENIHAWLKPGGRCFCMVPNAQRLHKIPMDYWRPLPDAVEWIFRSFAKTQLFVYGNPLTTIASLYGIAAEELTPAELDTFHPDYPVATCIVAEK